MTDLIRYDYRRVLTEHYGQFLDSLLKHRLTALKTNALIDYFDDSKYVQFKTLKVEIYI